MAEKHVVFVKRAACIGAFVIVAFAVMLSPGRAAAQAAPGPQAGAAPSDEPSSPTSHPVKMIGGHPSLAGNWTLNKDQSDDPREKMREAMGGGGGGGMGGGRGGFGGGEGRRGGQGGGQGPGGNMNAEFSQLTIEQTATSAKVTGSSGRVLAVFPADSSAQSGSNSSSNADNSQAPNNSGNDGDYGHGGYQAAPATAEWQGNELVATTQARRGSMTRTYELSPDGTQLYVITKLDNPRLQQPVTFRFVYDPASGNGGGSQ